MRRPLLCGLDPIGSKPHSRGLCGGQGSSPARRGERGWPKRASLLHLRRPSVSRPMRRLRRPPSLPHRLRAASRQPSHPSPRLAHHRQPLSLLLLHPSRSQPRGLSILRPSLPHRLQSVKRPSLPRWSGLLRRQLRRLPSRLPAILPSRQPPFPSSLPRWSGPLFHSRSRPSLRLLCSTARPPCSLPDRRFSAFLPPLPP